MFEKIKGKIALSLLDKKSFDTTSPELAGFFQGLYSMFSLPGQPVYTDLSASKAIREGYKMAIPVYRGIRSIIQAISGIPWVSLDKNGEEIPAHPFTTTWANPNPEFSGQDNMEYIVAHMILAGVAYLRPIYDTKQPREFWVEMPDRIQAIPSKDRSKWIDGWQYTDELGVKHTVAKETFIQFKQVDPGNFYTGMGAILPAGRVIDTYNEALDTQKVSMQNRGIPSGMLAPEEPLSTSEQFDEFKRKFKEGYLDKSSRREPWLFPRKMNWQEMSNTPVELDFNNSQQALIRQIAAAIGVDPWFIGDREHSTFNNVQEARKSLYEDVGLPILDDIKATLNLKVSPLYADKPQIAYDISNIPALREDFGKKTEQATRLWAMGVPFQQINSNLELGFEEFPGWDKPYLPFSVAPVTASGAQETQPDPDAGTKSLNMTEEQKVAEWKRIDSRRVGWWGVLGKRFEPLYAKLGDAVAKSPDKLDAVIEQQYPEWEKTLTAIALTLVEDFGQQTADRLKAAHAPLEYKFDPFSTAIRKWVAAHAAESVTTILATQREAMHDLIVQGINDNLTNTQIAKSIRQFYTDNARTMAMRVARTETAVAAGYGQYEAGKQSGANKRRWLSSRDDRVRDDHARMDGETTGINDKYSNGMAYVGDPAGGPENIINCRCVEQFFKE